MGVVTLGALVLDYSTTWVGMAAGLGSMASSLLVFRGSWITSATDRSTKSDD